MRPSEYSQDMADRICESIARGMSLVRTCDASDDMPSPRTVYRWLRENESFCQNYTRAKEDQADYLAEETLEISDNGEIDPQHKRIMVDTRKWLASKFKPKKYGDKIQQEVTGAEGQALALAVNFVSPQSAQKQE